MSTRNSAWRGGSTPVRFHINRCLPCSDGLLTCVAVETEPTLTAAVALATVLARTLDLGALSMDSLD